MFARMGAVLELERDQPKSENLHDLKELMSKHALWAAVTLLSNPYVDLVI